MQNLSHNNSSEIVSKLVKKFQNSEKVAYTQPLKTRVVSIVLKVKRRRIICNMDGTHEYSNHGDLFGLWGERGVWVGNACGPGDLNVRRWQPENLLTKSAKDDYCAAGCTPLEDSMAKCTIAVDAAGIYTKIADRPFVRKPQVLPCRHTTKWAETGTPQTDVGRKRFAILFFDSLLMQSFTCMYL